MPRSGTVHQLRKMPVNSSKDRSARLRQRGTVLLVAGEWPGSDASLGVEASEWHGLELGHGHLSDRDVVVSSGGRGEFGRRGRSLLRLPGRSLEFAASDAEPARSVETAQPGAPVPLGAPVRLDEYVRRAV